MLHAFILSVCTDDIYWYSDSMIKYWYSLAEDKVDNFESVMFSQWLFRL